MQSEARPAPVWVKARRELPQLALLRRGLAPAAPDRATVKLGVKMVLAGTLAWWLCTLLGAPRPLFAVLVPLVAMGGDPFGAINVSLGRVLGVFVGVLLGLALLQVGLPSTLLVAVLLACSLALGYLLRVGGALNNQIAITAMFMIYLGVGTRTGPVGVARIWETAVGAVIAVAVSVVLWPPDPVVEARARASRLCGWLGEDLERVAALLGSLDSEAAEAELELIRHRSLEAVGDVLELERAERSLRFNPRRRRDGARFAHERRRLTGAARQYRHLRTIARMVADASLAPEATPAGERARLVQILDALGEAATGKAPVPAIEPASLHDPRTVAMAVKLRQMADDLG